MATLSQPLKARCAAHPETLLPVVLTSTKKPAQLQAAGLGTTLEPIPGLDGIYKARLTGRQLLDLAHHPDIDTIEADEEVKALGQH